MDYLKEEPTKTTAGIKTGIPAPYMHNHSLGVAHFNECIDQFFILKPNVWFGCSQSNRKPKQASRTYTKLNFGRNRKKRLACFFFFLPFLAFFAGETATLNCDVLNENIMFHG